LKIVIFETLFSRDLDPNLGWPWKSYRRQCLIDPNKFHYLVCGCIEFDCGRRPTSYVRDVVRTYGRMDGQTDGRTFLPGLLGHLW